MESGLGRSTARSRVDAMHDIGVLENLGLRCEDTDIMRDREVAIPAVVYIKSSSR